MKNTLRIAIGMFLILWVASDSVQAQYSTRKLSKKQQAYTDSLKQVKYDYMFPFLGQQAYSRGFDLPYPVGLMINYIWMDQGIIIDNFQLGIQNENVDFPMTPIDLIEFGTSTNTSYAANFRPDIWVFPFLNVYGLFGYGQSTTEISLVEPVNLSSSVTQNMKTAGFGLMGAFGLGPLWTSVDANWTWTFPDLLEDPVMVRVLGIRLGKTFVFKQHPERNIAIWVGGMRARMASTTVGSIKMSDALPQDVFDRVDEIVDEYDAWYDSKPPEVQDRIDESALPHFIDALENNAGESIVSYGMDKSPVEEWNVVVGAQFQLNKKWMLRTEAGIIGDRKSWLASFNYRFQL